MSKRSSLERMKDLVDGWFCKGRGGREPRMDRIDDGRELLPDVMFQFRLLNRLNDQHEVLQLFRGLGRVGEELWEQEARVLVRISNLQHPGLPRVIQGGFLEEDGVGTADAPLGVGYILTEAAEFMLDYPGAMGILAQEDKTTVAVRQLRVLCNALLRLHVRGITHRNIWPGTIEVVTVPSEDTEIELRLARFEMSTLVSNLARRVSANQPAQLHAIRDLYRKQGSQALLCCPPERLALLYRFTDSDRWVASADTFEDTNSDVYGLGMLAYQWFVESIDQERLSRIFLSNRYDHQALSALQGEMRRKIRNAPKLPDALRRILLGMLDGDRRTRWTSAEVDKELAKHEESMEAAITASAPERSYLLSIAPDEFRPTLLRWGLLKNDPATEIGWQELRTFIETDLKGGVLAYSKEGFTPFYRGGSDPEVYKARYVLIGRQVAYFSAPFERRGVFNPGRVPEVLHIRHVLPMGWRDARHLEKKLLKQRLPRIEVTRFKHVPHVVQRPSWERLLRSVEKDVDIPAWQPVFEDAIKWLLELWKVRLAARRYPFRRKADTRGNNQYVRLLLDADREQTHRQSDNLLHLFTSQKNGRIPFGDFFDTSRESAIVYVSDEGHREVRGQGFFRQRLGVAEIEIERSAGSPPVPDFGWIFPADDLGDRESLRRQRQAVDDLLENQVLMEQLHRPRALMRLRGPQGDDVGEGLLGSGKTVVCDMLAYVPLYAVHGPPGTGKTTVTAEAVAAALRGDRSQRILISAQSHFSLDNIAERILKRFNKGEVLAMRLASGNTEAKVSPALQPYLPQTQAELWVKDILAHCTEELERPHPPAVLRILGEWRAHAEASTLEIKERARRGANLIFATCLGATERYMAASTEHDLFDWVIVEEAAKAWPTELVIPLVQGVQWTLIGDHNQLGAFGREEVETLLDACSHSDNEDLRRHGSSKDAYLSVFNLFRNLFTPPEDDPTFTLGRTHHPCGRLDRQFRMRRPIGELVSRVFYEGKLVTDESTDRDHGLEQPAALAGKALVWCDTAQIRDCSDEFGWKNPGEVRVVRALLEQLRPNPVLHFAGARQDRLAILTPYNDQVHELRNALPEIYRDAISTIDSFQGKEADIVLVSLVRSNDNDSARERLGHLLNRERVNVMLSRARRLLLLVGNYQHFQATDDLLWQDVLQEFAALGHRMSATDLVPNAQLRLATLGELAAQRIRREGQP